MWSSQGNSNSNASSKEKKNLRTLGMTSAISVAEPKPSDFTRTNELKEALKPYNVFESEEELNHRMEILSILNARVKEWIRETSIARNMPPNVAATEQVGEEEFGSTELHDLRAPHEQRGVEKPKKNDAGSEAWRKTGGSESHRTRKRAVIVDRNDNTASYLIVGRDAADKLSE
ncbi:Poly(A) polymerase gamma [Eufriesea mexicana]|nr:Poly(A) polymerase gamma [Eufriesea mexicana]